jgi:hypothetical protein
LSNIRWHHPYLARRFVDQRAVAGGARRHNDLRCYDEMKTACIS